MVLAFSRSFDSDLEREQKPVEANLDCDKVTFGGIIMVRLYVQKLCTGGIVATQGSNTRHSPILPALFRLETLRGALGRVR